MTYEEMMYQKLVVDDATNEATLDDLCPNSGASTGVCGCVSCSETTASERRILTDLIAELRTVNSEANLPPFNDMADRAEARLREVASDVL